MADPELRLRRSVLYVPAGNPRARAKAASLDWDAVVFDLEDAVAPDAKARARGGLVQAVRGHAADGRYGGREVVVRINGTDTADFAADLDAVASCRPHGVLLPKIDGPDALAVVADACRARSLADGLRLWAMVETPAALLSLDAIATAGVAASPRLDCLVIGTNDLAKDTGVSMADGRLHLRPWLMQAVLVAKRHRLAVLDGVWNDFADRAGFEAECAEGRAMGFDGKTLIHPTQIDAANRAFGATPDELAEAQRIVDAFARPEHAGAGVVNLGGRMAERLHLAQAERLLARAEAIASRR